MRLNKKRHIAAAIGVVMVILIAGTYINKHQLHHIQGISSSVIRSLYLREFHNKFFLHMTQTEQEDESFVPCSPYLEDQQEFYNKSFLYMTQTEHCLPYQLSDMNALGDSTVRDVIVLSYKKKCTNTSFPHVTYIFNTSTTWTTGRTELYYAAKRLNKKYLYYIFLDDDITIVPILTNLNSSSWWRIYEQFLLDKRPPLAALDNPNWQLVDKIRKARSKKHCTMNGTDPDYYLAKWFDAVINAFHHDAVEHLFGSITPYWTRFDSESWWMSQWYVNIMTDIVFHNQAMLPAHLLANNPMHRTYPQRMHARKDLKVIANDIRKIIPQQYRNSADSLLKRWTSAYEQILTTINDTYCHPIPFPRRKSIPYQCL